MLYLNIQRPENKLFSSSLYKINRILEEQYKEATAPKLAKEPQLLIAYYKYINVTLKEASDTLAPYYSYDHQIYLEKPNSLSFSLLYKITTVELEETRRYLIDNLYKGFITPSQAPFAILVLFVKKPTSSLRFCINFQKLNKLTCKDRYPLPLIDKMLAQISRAKIFIKLDIRQAFYQI